MVIAQWVRLGDLKLKKEKDLKKGTGYPILEPVLTSSGTGSQNSRTGPTGTRTGTRILGLGLIGTGTGSTRFDWVPEPAHLDSQRFIKIIHLSIIALA